MKFGSVCSGIEAASVAWHPLGWKAAFLSEIDKFPRAVLAHHYPTVPLHGDFTTIEKGQYADIDVLVGGTPCQSFSVAGLRKGLDDPRGNLMLEFGALAKRLAPRWIVWENVPGVLSSDGGRDFGTFLGMLGILGYGFAYRVLDAQFFGVAQRRRRVFVVGCLGDWHAAAAVLFERHSLLGHPAPSREKGKAAPIIPSRSTAGGGLGTDFDCDGGLIQHAPDVARCIATREGSSQDGTGMGTRLVPVAFHPTQDPISSADVCHSIGANDQATAAVATLFIQDDTTPKVNEERAGCLRRDAGGEGACVMTPAMQVRRLTPTECERLQGFPDGYTAIPWRKKPASECPDGPRYKALGNSMAVPVMRWIGQRLARVDAIISTKDVA